jgi:hypothetical protein
VPLRESPLGCTPDEAPMMPRVTGERVPAATVVPAECEIELHVAKIMEPTPSADMICVGNAPPSLIFPDPSKVATWPLVNDPVVVATFEVLPLMALMVVPFILNVFPVPAVS